MFGRKKSSVEETDYFLSTTKVTGDIVINGVTVFKDDGRTHRLSVRDGKICIDGKDVTNETVDKLENNEEVVDADFYKEDANVYFENLTINVGSVENVETDAPNTIIHTQEPDTSGYMHLNVECDGDLEVVGDIDGFIDVSGDVTISGHFRARTSPSDKTYQSEVDGDVSLGYLDGGKLIAYSDVSVSGTANGHIKSDGDVSISGILA